MFIIISLLTIVLLIVASIVNQVFNFILKFKFLIKYVTINITYSTWLWTFLIFSVCSSFITGVILNNFLLIGLSSVLSKIVLLALFLLFLIDLLNNIVDDIFIKRIVNAYLSGKPIAIIRKAVVLIPATLFGITIVFILVYNLYQLPSPDMAYFSIDSDFFIRFGKHNPSGWVNDPVLNLNTNSATIEDELKEKLNKIFNENVNRHPWLISIPVYEKYKLLHWFRDRLLWCQIYHSHISEIPLEEDKWIRISADIKKTLVMGHSFEVSSIQWRHDPYDLDVPTGTANNPRICIKFYHN